MSNIKQLEEKLNQHKQSMEELEKEIEKLKGNDMPKVGDFCKFWNDNKHKGCYAYLNNINYMYYCSYYTSEGVRYKNCEKAHFTPDTIDVRDVYKNPQNYEVVYYNGQNNSEIHDKIADIASYVLGHINITHKGSVK